MGKYILTFEGHKKSKKKIWDELLKLKKRDFKSVKIEPEKPENSPELMIPTGIEGG